VSQLVAHPAHLGHPLEAVAQQELRRLPPEIFFRALEGFLGILVPSGTPMPSGVDQRFRGVGDLGVAALGLDHHRLALFQTLLERLMGGQDLVQRIAGVDGQLEGLPQFAMVQGVGGLFAHVLGRPDLHALPAGVGRPLHDVGELLVYLRGDDAPSVRNHLVRQQRRLVHAPGGAQLLGPLHPIT